MLDQSGGPWTSTPEGLAYKSYLRAFVNAGWLFTAAASFYSLECNDGRPACCPFAMTADRAQAVLFNRYWFSRLQSAGIPAGPEQPWGSGFFPFRLATGCSANYKALSLLFEVNDRYPDYRLTIEGLQELGADYVLALHDWLATPEGVKVMANQRDAQRLRMIALEAWSLKNCTMTLEHPSFYEMLILGY